MTNVFRLDRSGDESSLTFDCGELLVDDVVVDAGFEPNGYFWEGVLSFAAPAVADALELDSEAGMFAAYGPVAQVEEAQRALTPLVSDTTALRVLIERAAAEGVDLEEPVDEDEGPSEGGSFFGRLFGRR